MRIKELLTRLVLALSFGILSLVLAYKVGGWLLVAALTAAEIARNVGTSRTRVVLDTDPMATSSAILKRSQQKAKQEAKTDGS